MLFEFGGIHPRYPACEIGAHAQFPYARDYARVVINNDHDRALNCESSDVIHLDITGRAAIPIGVHQQFARWHAVHAQPLFGESSYPFGPTGTPDNLASSRPRLNSRDAGVDGRIVNGRIEELHPHLMSGIALNEVKAMTRIGNRAIYIEDCNRSVHAGSSVKT